MQSRQSGVVDAFECIAGRTPIAFGRSYVDRIVEMEVSPAPPFTHTAVNGLAFRGNELVVIISLDGASGKRSAQAGARVVKAILLAVAGRSIRYGLEVQAAQGFVSVRNDPNASRPGADLPVWVSHSVLVQERKLAWLDIPAMIHALEGAA
jgi:hypothetical protein